MAVITEIAIYIFLYFEYKNCSTIFPYHPKLQGSIIAMDCVVWSQDGHESIDGS